jgi:methylated-DNA-[protein]-cysteine S-methyltransferase
MRYAGYVAEGWGVGELVLDGDTLVHSEAPKPSAAPPPGSHWLGERLRAYFVAGAQDDFLDVELDLEGATPFQQAVCHALRGVPYGETVTYGELAALAGHPNAQRAVGSFCAANRFAIVVPCHRVVGADGSLTGYAGGLERKRTLLDLEGRDQLLF